MPKLSIDVKKLTITLSTAEKLAAFHGNLQIPLNKVLGASVVDSKFWSGLGLRVPGTGLPGILIAGTFIKKGDRAFVWWSRRRIPVEITLSGHGYNRMVISASSQAEAETWADTVNAYITGC
jgi:hypothetical protein